MERLFRTYMNCSPAKYYLGLRLIRASQLLHQTSKSVQQVAVCCGFSSAAHFSRCYRDHYGVPPRSDQISSRYRMSAFAESMTGGRDAVGRGRRAGGRGRERGARGMVARANGSDEKPALTVGFLLTNNFTLTALSSFIDALRLAADEGDGSRPIRCRWRILGRKGEPSVSSCGIAVARPMRTLSPPVSTIW